jgi:hypothetical protein
MKLLNKEPDFYSMPPLVDEEEDDDMVANVFGQSSKFLPVTAVAPSVPPTTTQVPAPRIVAPLIPSPAPLKLATYTSAVVKRPNMLLSSPRTIVSSSSASDSDSDESHQNHVSYQKYAAAAAAAPQQLRAFPSARPSQLSRAPPARLIPSCEQATNHPGPSHGDPSFVNELNETIFMHELAMGCSILCQLRRGDSNL